MIRVLQIVPTLGYGGVARVVRNYYDALDKSKYHFDFVTHGEKEDYHDQLISMGSKVFYFQTIGKLGVKKYENQIKQNIDIEGYDIIHIHTGLITGIYAKCFKMCGAKRVICHAHTTRAISRKQKLLEPYFRHLARKYADLNMACGPDAGEYCFGKANFVILPNGINYAAFNDVSDNEIKRIRDELGIQPDRFVIGHVGLFAPVKNHAFLVRIAKAFTSTFADAVFVMCGGGPCFEEVKELVMEAGLESNVVFTGVRNDVNALMHIFDVFILPSFHEGLPVVGIEAQTVGLRCLLSDRIDRSVDIGCDLCSFLSIDNGVEVWINELVKVRQNRGIANGDEVKKALIERNYEISRTCEILTKSYEELICDSGREKT